MGLSTGGYIEGTTTWTVKLANVSFYKNLAKGLPAGSVIDLNYLDNFVLD